MAYRFKKNNNNSSKIWISEWIHLKPKRKCSNTAKSRVVDGSTWATITRGSHVKVHLTGSGLSWLVRVTALTDQSALCAHTQRSHVTAGMKVLQQAASASALFTLHTDQAQQPYCCTTEWFLWPHRLIISIPMLVLSDSGVMRRMNTSFSLSTVCLYTAAVSMETT